MKASLGGVPFEFESLKIEGPGYSNTLEYDDHGKALKYCREAISRPLRASFQFSVDCLFLDPNVCHDRAGGPHRWRLHGSRWTKLLQHDEVEGFRATMFRVATLKRCSHCGQVRDA